MPEDEARLCRALPVLSSLLLPEGPGANDSGCRRAGIGHDSAMILTAPRHTLARFSVLSQGLASSGLRRRASRRDSHFVSLVPGRLRRGQKALPPGHRLWLACFVVAIPFADSAGWSGKLGVIHTIHSHPQYLVCRLFCRHKNLTFGAVSTTFKSVGDVVISGASGGDARRSGEQGPGSRLARTFHQ